MYDFLHSHYLPDSGIVLKVEYLGSHSFLEAFTKGTPHLPLSSLIHRRPHPSLPRSPPPFPYPCPLPFSTLVFPPLFLSTLFSLPTPLLLSSTSLPPPPFAPFFPIPQACSFALTVARSFRRSFAAFGKISTAT